MNYHILNECACKAKGRPVYVRDLHEHYAICKSCGRTLVEGSEWAVRYVWNENTKPEKIEVRDVDELLAQIEANHAERQKAAAASSAGNGNPEQPTKETDTDGSDRQSPKRGGKPKRSRKPN